LSETAISRHKVKPGDTWTRIAAKYHVSVSDLERANKASAKKMLKTGTWIRIPVKGDASSVEPAGKRAKSRAVSSQAKVKTKSANLKAAAAKKATAKAKAKKSNVIVKQAKTKVKSDPQAVSLKHPLEPKSDRKQIASK